jgi:hypothetical protein
MKCAEAKRLFSPTLDSMLDCGDVLGLERHIAECESCAIEFAGLRHAKWLLATMPSQAAPADLELRLNVAIAQRLAATNKRGRGFLGWENALNAYMLPATGGLLTAILMFGLLIGILVPAHLHVGNDVPTMLYTPPEMTAAPFGLDQSGGSDAVLVEAVIDSHGRVQDYRVLNPAGPSELSPQMKNALIFTQFRPATSFGLPTSGRVFISFSNINVGG